METSILGRPTFGGLASGLDTNALLEGLLAIERQPLQRIQARRAEVDNQRGLMRSLNTKLMALRDAAEEIDNRNTAGTGDSLNEEFLRYSGTTTNEDVVEVSAGFGASPGAIDIVVNRLATGSRRFSLSHSDARDASVSPALSAGQSLTIDLPNGDPDAFPPVDPTLITVSAAAGTALSLMDVRDQINTAEENGGKVRADVLQVSEDDFRLVLTSTGTGASNDMTVTGDLAMDLDPARNQVAEDAEIVVFGETITRESNTIDDVMTGITLRLVGTSEIDEDNPPADPADPPNRLAETVSIEVDTEEVAATLEKFVKAYNDVVSFIDNQFKYNEASKKAGPLSGDFTLRSIQRELQELVSEGYSFTQNANNPFAPGGNARGGTVSGIGIDVEGGGRLRLDADKLEEALSLDPASVREFLSGRLGAADQPGEDAPWEAGFATAMADRLEEMVRSGDGTLATREKGFTQKLDTFDKSIERFESRLSKREETLVARFTELERIVAGLQSQQGFLGGIG